MVGWENMVSVVAPACNGGLGQSSQGIQEADPCGGQRVLPPKSESF